MFSERKSFKTEKKHSCFCSKEILILSRRSRQSEKHPHTPGFECLIKLRVTHHWAKDKGLVLPLMNTRTHISLVLYYTTCHIKEHKCVLCGLITGSLIVCLSVRELEGTETFVVSE